MQGQILDSTYRIIEEIGRGGFGAVYKAVRIGSEGSGAVAIKLLNYNPTLKTEDYVRFQREATLMSQLLHPGVVMVYELGEDAKSYFIVMELVQGSNLREFVKSRTETLPLNEILDVLIQAAEALEYVHEHDIIHRDIKPQNILICETRVRSEQRLRVKLVDFGIARLNVTSVESRKTEDVMGTFSYMAPEATGLVEGNIDNRTDIYSLGVVAYELLAGRTPFAEHRNKELLQAHVAQDPPAIGFAGRNDYRRILERIIMKCLAKVPEARYQSMFALVCDLKKIQVDLKARRFDDFAIATKDFALGKLLNSIFIARNEIIDDILKFILSEKRRSRLWWGVISGGIGLGKSRILGEIRKSFTREGINYLYLRFSESEQRLPFQALSLAINEYMAALERNNKFEYRELVTNAIHSLGEVANELARLIPPLRQQMQNSGIYSVVSPSDFADKAEVDEEGERDDFFDRRYLAPNPRINKAFVELLAMLGGRNSNLVFLMDDIHLADSSTISLFSFMIEQVNNEVNFSFILTMRDPSPRTNTVLEGFVQRLQKLNRRYRHWTLSAFDVAAIKQYLEALGITDLSDTFVDFVASKVAGSPAQLTTLVKQMLAQNVLIPSGNLSSVSFRTDLALATQVDLDSVNIELLIATLDSIDKIDLHLMQIAAVSQDACEFGYFRLDENLEIEVLEEHLLAMVRRGIFEVFGDENAPIQALRFHFPHERIRKAVLDALSSAERQQMHLALAKRIQKLFQNPLREHIVALAKHFDGARGIADPAEAGHAFLRAARICIKTYDHNLAQYYIGRMIDCVENIPTQSVKMELLRGVYEAEYLIYSAQGHLVAASDAFRQLIDITQQKQQRDILMVYWIQILMGLGRNQVAWENAHQILKERSISLRGGILEPLIWLNWHLMPTLFYPAFLFILQVLFAGERKRLTNGVALQAICLYALTQFHGIEESPRAIMFLGARAGLLQSISSRWSASFNVLHAAVIMRTGDYQKAYRLCETMERALETQGKRDAQRWIRVIRALWLDYPLGRMDRLLDLIDNRRESVLPQSGIMHFEAYGMKAWIRLLAPTSLATKEAQQNEAKRRRKSDRSHVSNKVKTPREIYSENNNARRILDSGENGHFTALALFSDALRFALSDKMDLLKRTTEQLRRLSPGSQIGKVLSGYAYSLQALILGHQHEACRLYLNATKGLWGTRTEVLSLLVSDAIRLAVCFLPWRAVFAQARGWPWGRDLAIILLNVDKKLLAAEGERNLKRNVIGLLYRGMVAHLSGDSSKALRLVDESVREARSQRVDLLECLGLAILAGIEAKVSKRRAADHMTTALRMAREFGFKLLERQIFSMAKAANISLNEVLSADDSIALTPQRTNESATNRSRNTNDLVAVIRMLYGANSIESILNDAARHITHALQTKSAYVFLFENQKSRNRYICRTKINEIVVNVVDEVVLDEKDFIRWLPTDFEEQVKLIPMDSEFIEMTVLKGQQPAPAKSQLIEQEHINREITNEITQATEDLSATKTITLTKTVTATKTITTQQRNTRPNTSNNEEEVPRPALDQRRKDETAYLILVAIMAGSQPLGWFVFPRVLLRNFQAGIEQDLEMLGFHTGHLIRKIGRSTEQQASSASTAVTNLQSDATHSIVRSDGSHAKLSDYIEGGIPRHVLVDYMGILPEPRQLFFRMFHLKNRKSLIMYWRIVGKKSSDARALSNFLDRHLKYLSSSLARRSETHKIEAMNEKIFVEMANVFEDAAHRSGKLESIDFNYVLLDLNESYAIEGDCGSENRNFSGNSEVSNEIIRELGTVLVADKLVYRMQTRRLNGPGGWLFVASEAARRFESNFSRTEFVEQYLAERKDRGPHLAGALDCDSKPPPLALAVFVSRPPGS